jgi:L-threonylcarbamoyladenylate synthase
MYTPKFMKNLVNLEQAVGCLQKGEIIAYPTEAVYGLGCDPFNEGVVKKLLHVKHRPIEKGVILVAANVSQIQDLVCIGGEKWEHKVLDSWPGPNTWVIPVKKELPEWITGGRETLAVKGGYLEIPFVALLLFVFPSFATG